VAGWERNAPCRRYVRTFHLDARCWLQEPLPPGPCMPCRRDLDTIGDLCAQSHLSLHDRIDDARIATPPR